MHYAGCDTLQDGKDMTQSATTSVTAAPDTSGAVKRDLAAKVEEVEGVMLLFFLLMAIVPLHAFNYISWFPFVISASSVIC